jgi:hypothetical protein
MAGEDRRGSGETPSSKLKAQEKHQLPGNKLVRASLEIRRSDLLLSFEL